MIANKSDISDIDPVIYIPDPVTDLKKEGFKFLRVVGWRTLLGKLYWVFSYTDGDSWGLNNYKLIPQGTKRLSFIHFEISD